VRKIIPKWKTFEIAAYLSRRGSCSKFSTSSDHATLRAAAKKHPIK